MRRGARTDDEARRQQTTRRRLSRCARRGINSNKRDLRRDDVPGCVAGEEQPPILKMHKNHSSFRLVCRTINQSYRDVAATPRVPE